MVGKMKNRSFLYIPVGPLLQDFVMAGIYLKKIRLVADQLIH